MTRRRRRRQDELLTLIKEDMRLQREAEERQERTARMDRLFSLLGTTELFCSFFTVILLFS